MREISFVLFILAFWGCQLKDDLKVLKLAHSLDTNHPVHRSMVHLGERLKEISKGEMNLEIYPSGQLGNERECLELLQIGSLTMTKVSSGVLENFVPEFKVLGLPYMFKNKEHRYKVLDGPIGRDLLNKGTDFRFLGLCFYDAGYRSFYTKENPINSPNDLIGQKIRVMKSAMAVDMVNELGAAATPVSWGELYTALQQGVVDGAENNPPSFYSSKHYEICKYYTLDEHTSIPDVLLISLEQWNELSDQQKTWVRKASLESAIYQRDLWQLAEEEALQEVEKHGVSIIRPAKTLFATKVESMVSKYEKSKLFGGVVKAIQNDTIEK